MTWANRALRPDRRLIGIDACMPISRLLECILESQDDVAASSLVAPLAGHVGDGNFHRGIVFDPASTASGCTAFISSKPSIRRAWC